jgi:hypothetical protein
LWAVFYHFTLSSLEVFKNKRQHTEDRIQKENLGKKTGKKARGGEHERGAKRKGRRKGDRMKSK